MARSTVKVPGKWQVVATVSFGTSHRTGLWLLRQLLCRLLRHCTSSVNNHNSRLVGRLHPRRLPVANKVPFPPQAVVVVGGQGFNASYAYLCPHPTRHRSQAGATFTSRFGGKNSSFLLGISRLCRQCSSNGFLLRGQTWRSTLQLGTQSAARNDRLARQLSSTKTRLAPTRNYHRRPRAASGRPSSPF